MWKNFSRTFSISWVILKTFKMDVWMWIKNCPNWFKNCIFGHFGPNIAIFCTFCPMPDQKQIWTRCLGGFSVMWVTKLLISPVKKRIFCPTTTKFGPKFVFLVNLGQAMQVYSVPCWWVGWWLWRAGCFSQDTYLLYHKRENNKQEQKRTANPSWFVGAISGKGWSINP